MMASDDYINLRELKIAQDGYLPMRSGGDALMSNDFDTFVEKCLRDEAKLDEIDDFVEVWHQGADKRALHRFLGMDEREYALWIVDPDAIGSIVAARRSRSAA